MDNKYEKDLLVEQIDRECKERFFHALKEQLPAIHDAWEKNEAMVMELHHHYTQSFLETDPPTLAIHTDYISTHIGRVMNMRRYLMTIIQEFAHRYTPGYKFLVEPKKM